MIVNVESDALCCDRTWWNEGNEVNDVEWWRLRIVLMLMWNGKAGTPEASAICTSFGRHFLFRCIVLSWFYCFHSFSFLFMSIPLFFVVFPTAKSTKNKYFILKHVFLINSHQIMFCFILIYSLTYKNHQYLLNSIQFSLMTQHEHFKMATLLRHIVPRFNLLLL